MNHAIEVRGLSTSFGSKKVHDNLSFDVVKGETLAIVGGSGSGKSTLLRKMSVLSRITSGSVNVLGYSLTAISEKELLALRRRVGVLFQGGALFGAMNVRENVAMPLREHTRLSIALIHQLSRLKLTLTGLAPQTGELYPSQLSGGMVKRAALARAIALDPELLFLDEPTSGLDPVTADALDDLVLQLKTSLRPTIVLVTHDMDSLWKVADRVLVLAEGKIAGMGSVSALAGSNRPAIQRFFQSRRGRAANTESSRDSS